MEVLHTTIQAAQRLSRETDAFLVCVAWVVFLFNGYERNIFATKTSSTEKLWPSHFTPGRASWIFSTIRLPPRGTLSLSMRHPKHDFIRITDRGYFALLGFNLRMHVFLKTPPPPHDSAAQISHLVGCSRSLRVSQSRRELLYENVPPLCTRVIRDSALLMMMA